MDTLTNEQVQIALARLERPLARYSWLQRQVRLCDVSTNEEFQRRFSGFYRVRRNLEWRVAYFGLLESTKKNGIIFPEALEEIARRCGRIEASFASKLVATLDASKPVIDKFVLGYFKLKLPRFRSVDRERKTVGLYLQLCEKYEELIQTPTGKLILEHFNLCFPTSEISELKKVDLVLWQIRR